MTRYTGNHNGPRLREGPDDEVLQRLRRARVLANLTQEQAGEALGYSNGMTIYRLENGKTNLDMLTLKSMCELYDVSMVWVLTGANVDAGAMRVIKQLQLELLETKVALKTLIEKIDDTLIR